MWQKLDSKIEGLSNRMIIFLSSIGTIFITTTIIHVSFSEILPLTQFTSGFIMFFPAIFIGLLNEDIKESLGVMFISLFGSIIFTSITRMIPSLIGIFPREGDFFNFIQVAETLPLFFMMFPFFVLGTTFGVLLNEFVLNNRY